MSGQVDALADGRGLWVRYAVLLVVYVALGYLTKSVVLNWIIGPLFPLIVLYLVPTLWRRLRDGVSPT